MFFILSWTWDKGKIFKPQTFRFHTLMLYHWATETLQWARSIMKFVWHTSSKLLGSAVFPHGDSEFFLCPMLVTRCKTSFSSSLPCSKLTISLTLLTKTCVLQKSDFSGFQDEGTYQLKKTARNLMNTLGSENFKNLNFRDMWAFVVHKRGSISAEGHRKAPNFDTWGEPLTIQALVTLQSQDSASCSWEESDVTKRRREFCEKFEGYGSVCSCKWCYVVAMNELCISH